MDYYAVLGLGRNAEADAIGSAYRRSALASNPECNQHHPDHVALTKTFTQVSQAYTVLSIPRTRAIYDQYGEDGVRHGGTGNVGVPGGVKIDEIDPYLVFRRFFGVDDPFQVLGNLNGVQNNHHQFFSTTAAKDKNPPKASPLHVDLHITLEDIFHGNIRRIEWISTHYTKRGEVSGSTLSRSQEVEIPKGIKEGDSMTLLSNGDTKEGHSQGDVIVTFRVDAHEYYQRRGNDLVVTVQISLVEALCGAIITVTTIEGRHLPLQIDEIVHPHFNHIIPDEGLPIHDTPGRRGNLVVECTTEFPRYLSSEQKTEVKRILECEKH